MAAKRRYALPSEQMVALAREARRQGLSFEEWWQLAIRPDEPPILVTKPKDWKPGAVLWPSDSADRNAWRLGTIDAKEGWRRAYENIPATTAEHALKLLEPIFGSIDFSAPIPEGMDLVPAVAA